ncbi:YbgC/FadM family acyl-CoA thioesterase [Parvibaculum sp.]|uniref:YbgC/FadM family acyl-CoA thioesterase n=1 Tax=Parvibaculum sp. TaxID=2024848 RepID=UPI001B0CEAD9|nr:YbgC/FadM family acyl-CoA thioesterase [Parvibaculum sp.]MBO6667836.1 YbgC/FadM family acyl-CoA thioesterase [Parvibaculum sp.]MBO6690699.1 YbgC/FadM family acyl-CoA thioesterase [Parvibaculum sp.]MBO6714928.1 YbgC/FadM family acyl-CoA thioesterase [Parvibaculum sp.]
MSEWPDIAGRIEGRVHKLGIRVYYEDTDFSGIVYHANYLRFAERGRSDFLRLAGVHHTDLFGGEDPVAFAIHRMEMDFRQPARIDDRLEVHTVYVRASGARIEAEQSIWRLGPEGDLADELWRAKVFAAVLDRQGRPRRLPASVKDALAPYVSGN